METADSLAAASSKETPLGAAVLLEQSSGHYNRAGMQRKFAFHMLMAGHMFRSAGQEYHAVRCFASAMYVYHGGDRFWPELFNHLLSALAGQLYGMKRMQLSLQLYAKLVGTTGGGRVSVRSQQKFLDHLVAICRGYENDALESAKRMKLFYLRSDTSHFDEAAELLKFNARARGRLEARRKSDESTRGVGDVEENDVVRIENGHRSKDLVENEIEDIEVAEAHGSDDDVLQEYAIAKEAFSDAMKDIQ